MEVFATDHSIILLDGEKSLWFSKSSPTNNSSPRTSRSPDRNTQFAVMTPKVRASIEDSKTAPVFLGLCYGVIGKFRATKLVLIRDREAVGYFPGLSGKQHEVFKINRVAVLDVMNAMEETDDLLDQKLENLVTAVESKTSSRPSSSNSKASNNMARKTWNSMKTVTVGAVKSGSKMVASKASNLTASVVTSGEVSDTEERLEKRLSDELMKMFSESDSFYYSPTGDLTNSIQRKFSKDSYHESDWSSLDDRFFWNRFMLNDLIIFPDQRIASPWIIPVIQGYFHYEKCPYHDAFSFNTNQGSPPKSTSNLASPSKNSQTSKASEQMTTACDTHSKSTTSQQPKDSQGYEDNMKECTPVMILISRRSRFRAGTRYKRRGVDEEGFVGNYVETEQIFKYNKHVVSFLQVRGSIPIYWSQVGSSYRPPPILDRSHDESQESFKKHFDRELSTYGKQVIVNLVESSGRERVLHEAYLHHVLTFDSPDITYVSFDFHDYCRGMKFENVSVLIDSLIDIIKEMKFTWVDDQGIICSQEGVFRVNCVDCLDRTNIVETAIARTVMDLQFTRLGLLPPEGMLPNSWRSIFQKMWANNGDVVSKQYAGTNALKSDFTRTGKTKLTGMVKDSYNSATRYYQNRFRDTYRQAVIDFMCGVESKESFMTIDDEKDIDEEEDTGRHERVKQVIEDVKKLLIPENEVILGGWPLIDCDPNNGGINMDSVLILTQEAYFVSEYDEVSDRVTRCQKVFLEDIEKMELGLEPSSSAKNACFCIRIFYSIQSQSGYFHMLKSTGTRFFNNMAIPVKTKDDEMESLKAIVESFRVALSVKSISVPVIEGGRLDKKTSRQHQSCKSNPFGGILTESPSGLARSVGRQALSGMSSLLPMTKIKKMSRPITGTGSLGSSIAGPALSSSAVTFVSYTSSSETTPMTSSRNERLAGEKIPRELTGEDFHSQSLSHTIQAVQQPVQEYLKDSSIAMEETKTSKKHSTPSSGDDSCHDNQRAKNYLFYDSSEASDYSLSIFVKEGGHEDDDPFVDEEDSQLEDEAFDDEIPVDDDNDDGVTPVPDTTCQPTLGDKRVDGTQSSPISTRRRHAAGNHDISQEACSQVSPSYLESCGSILSNAPSATSSLKNSLSDSNVAVVGNTGLRDRSEKSDCETSSGLTASYVQRLSTSRHAMHGTHEIKNEQTKRERLASKGGREDHEVSTQLSEYSEPDKANPGISSISEEAVSSLPMRRPNILVTADSHNSSTSSVTRVKPSCDVSALQTTVSMIDVNQPLNDYSFSGKEATKSASGVTFFLGSNSGAKSMMSILKEPNDPRQENPDNKMLGQNCCSNAQESSVGLSIEIQSSQSMKNSRSANEMMSLMKSISGQTSGSSPLILRKDLVLNPLNKIAKGVQSLGINASQTASYILSPSGHSVSRESSSTSLNSMAVVSPRKQRQTSGLLDSYDELKRRKRNTKTRIIEL